MCRRKKKTKKKKLISFSIKQIPTRRAIYFATWGYKSGNKGVAGFSDDYFKMQQRLRDGIAFVYLLVNTN